MSIKEQLSKLVKSDSFWGDDPSVLFDSSRMVEFVPTEDMTRVEKLNAIARLAIYAGVLMSIVYQQTVYFYISLVVIAITWLINRAFPESALQQEQRQQGQRQQGQRQSGGGGGRVDENGNPFQEPTKDNPFMNVLLTDYVDNPTRPSAGDIEDPTVRGDIQKMFDHGLYKDVDDVWNRNNSQRQYYSNPSTTIPNDRDSFMNWCWNTPYVCKDGDQSACLKYDDLRAHGQIT